MEERTGGRSAGLGLIAAVAVLLAALSGLVAAGALAATAPPSQDPFYDEPAGLETAKPGKILRKRDVMLSLGGTVPVSARQFLYRTTNQLGEPSATVATLIRPPAPTGATRLLSYQTAYDGVADTCRPSYALLPGNSGANAIVTAESALISTYLLQGYTIVTSDYQGPSDDFGAGREEGQGTLDAIRAAEAELGVKAGTTPTGLVGYSGGSIASMWAAQLAPAYAPELKLIGVAAAGIPTDFRHNLDYIGGSPDWAGAIPAVGIGLARGHRLDLGKMLSAEGRAIADQVFDGCLEPAAFPGLKLQDMLKPKYQDIDKDPSLVKVFNESIMGRDGTPQVPLLMGVGNDDGIGDSVMIAKDVQELAHTYCDRGVPVRFNEYMGADHTAGFAAFAPQAIVFLASTFAGLPPDNGCPIPAGNPLTPIPEPAGKAITTTGLTIEKPKRAKKKFTVLVRAPSSPLTDVALKVKTKRKGAKAKTKKIAVGDIGYVGTRLTLPGKAKKGTKFKITGTARMQTDDVGGKLNFRAR